MSRPIAFVDLDDTLFQTRRKCPPGAEPLETMALDRDGRPLSFATPRQTGFLRWLTATAKVVPVTARSREAFSRVRLPVGPAVCAHGGVILDEEGAVDPVWAARMAGAALEHAEALQSLTREAERAAPAGVRVQLLREDGVGLYVLIKPRDHENAAGLDTLVEHLRTLAPAGWTMHRNDAVAALLPPFLGKAHAVARLLTAFRRSSPDAPILGIGDSFTDSGFMALCDYAVTPTGSQLAQRLLAAAA